MRPMCVALFTSVARLGRPAPMFAEKGLTRVRALPDKASIGPCAHPSQPTSSMPRRRLARLRGAPVSAVPGARHRPGLHRRADRARPSRSPCCWRWARIRRWRRRSRSCPPLGTMSQRWLPAMLDRTDGNLRGIVILFATIGEPRGFLLAAVVGLGGAGLAAGRGRDRAHRHHQRPARAPSERSRTASSSPGTRSFCPRTSGGSSRRGWAASRSASAR